MARKNKSTCAQALEAIQVKSNFDIKDKTYTQFSLDLFLSDSLSLRSKAVLLYLHSKPKDWQPRVYDIKKKFGWRDYAWSTVRKNLEQN